LTATLSARRVSETSAKENDESKPLAYYLFITLVILFLQ